MAIHLRILSGALIFILRLRFPPGKSIAKIITARSSEENRLYKCVALALHNITLYHIQFPAPEQLHIAVSMVIMVTWLDSLEGSSKHFF